MGLRECSAYDSESASQSHPEMLGSAKNPFRIPPNRSLYKEDVLKKEKNVIISAHGNSLRSLCKKIFNITDGSIIELEIPTGNPIHITFNEDMILSNYLYLDKKRAKKILINE